MKLEFLLEINEFNEHAVRLSSFDSRQAKAFQKAILTVILDRKNPLHVHELDFIEAINCSFTMRIDYEDIGIEDIEGKHLYCDLTLSSYKKMVELIEPFCNKESKGYQWLYDVDTPIDLLFSAGDM